jgi:16S rRNA (adenine1518-N6/adenine1519-N6)-dimethyltransferase
LGAEVTAYHAKKRLGQNFLKDKTVIRDIIDVVDPSPGVSIIEVGPGRGSLTLGLAESGAKILAVEFDSDVIGYLTKLLRKHDNVEILNRDFLSFDPPSVSGERFTIVGNLPYNIASPVLNWCVGHHNVITRAVFMVQKEMAARIGASAGGKNWSPLSIFTQLYFDVEECFDVQPESFRPAPKVRSTVIRLTPCEPEKVEDYAFFDKVVRASFARRRKTLRNNLVPGLISDNEKADKIFAELDLPADSRAEQLTTVRFLDLTKALARYNIL